MPLCKVLCFRVTPVHSSTHHLKLFLHNSDPLLFLILGRNIQDPSLCTLVSCTRTALDANLVRVLNPTVTRFLSVPATQAWFPCAPRDLLEKFP